MFIKLFLSLVLSMQIWAQAPERELNLVAPPSQADVVAIMNHANHKFDKINQVRQGGCKIDYNPAKQINLESGEYVCFMPSSTLKKWIADPRDQVSYEFKQENDAALWNVARQQMGDQNAPVSDDQGDTLKLGGKYCRENDTRQWCMKMDSALFTRVVDVDGKKKDKQGRYYLETLEETTIRFSAELKDPDDPSFRKVGEVGLRYRTGGSGVLARPAQEKWHEHLYKNLEYHYVSGASSELIGEVQMGVKKMFEADLSDIHCSASGTAMVGVDTNGKPLATSRIEGQVNTGNLMGGSRDTPLFALLLAREDRLMGREHRSETTAEVQTSLRTSSSSAVVIGVGQLVRESADNTLYTLQSARNGREPIHYIRLIYRKNL